jgi:hypothetical protein
MPFGSFGPTRRQEGSPSKYPVIKGQQIVLLAYELCDLDPRPIAFATPNTSGQRREIRRRGTCRTNKHASIYTVCGRKESMASRRNGCHGLAEQVWEQAAIQHLHSRRRFGVIIVARVAILVPPLRFLRVFAAVFRLASPTISDSGALSPHMARLTVATR